MNFKESRILFIILLVAFLVRFYNFNFPYFTSDEAQLSVRAHSLATTGKDELGRPFPLLFNSLTDYKLPVTSYLTAIGAKLFGKNDFGVRIPFILIGVGIVFLIYQISKNLTDKKEFGIFVSLLAALSPPLILLSRVPNQIILLIFGFLLLFYLLIREKINLKAVGLAIILALSTSKNAWFITVPYVLVIIYGFRSTIDKKIKLKLSLLAAVLTIAFVGMFLSVPQSKRSLMENNFSIFSDISIVNTINKLRGQGVESGLPPVLEKTLFNKSEFLSLGFLNWGSNLNPSIYFGEYDESLFKVLLIPFIAGAIYLIGRGQRKEKTLLFLPLVFTFPSFFTRHGINGELASLTSVAIILISGYGFIRLGKKASLVIFAVVILELAFILLTLDRGPSWITSITADVYAKSTSEKVALSDDIAPDAIHYISWHNPLDISGGFLDIPSPYKFRQTKIGNIKLIGNDDEFYNCVLEKPGYIIASKRDLNEIQTHLNIKDDGSTVEKIYKDNKGDEVGYLLKPIICIKGF